MCAIGLPSFKILRSISFDFFIAWMLFELQQWFKDIDSTHVKSWFYLQQKK